MTIHVVTLSGLRVKLTRSYNSIANMKVSTFHIFKFIANAVLMGLYNGSAMATILDMQISKFSNSYRTIHQRWFRKKCKNQINIDDWRVFTSIFKMQITLWWPFWICKFADFQSRIIHQSVQKINREDRMNIDNWRVIAVTLYMQISLWRPS